MSTHENTDYLDGLATETLEVLDGIAQNVRTLEDAAGTASFTAFEAHLKMGEFLAYARKLIPQTTKYGHWVREQGFKSSTRWLSLLREAGEHAEAIRALTGTGVPVTDEDEITSDQPWSIKRALAAVKGESLKATPQEPPKAAKKAAKDPAGQPERERQFPKSKAAQEAAYHDYAEKAIRALADMESLFTDQPEWAYRAPKAFAAELERVAQGVEYARQVAKNAKRATGLRNVNGRTPEEAASFQAKAAELEAKDDAGLLAGAVA